MMYLKAISIDRNTSNTKEVKNRLILGIVLFIVSEVFAFLFIFQAFFYSSLSLAINIVT